MAKIYTLDEKLLVGTPEIRIKEKIYGVDDRQKTVKKILKICDKGDEAKDFDTIDEVFKLAFSPTDYKEIEKLDIPFAAYQELFMLVISAVTGQEPEKISDRFQKEKEK